MNRVACRVTLASLSPADIVGLTFMYPANPPVAGTVPVFRYYGGGDHFYTTDYSELGDGSQNPAGYIFEGIGFSFLTPKCRTVFQFIDIIAVEEMTIFTRLFLPHFQDMYMKE